MGYKIFASMNIAIIGVSEVAETLAAGFAFAGHNVYMAWKDGENPGRSRALQSMENLTVCSIEEAANLSDMIIIATAPKDVREVAYWLGDVRRKVIIDATSNVYTPDDELVKTVGGIQSITGSAHIIKVFCTQGYEQLLKPLFSKTRVDLILVGDSKKAKAITEILTIELGMKYFYDFGGNEAIPLFNEMTTCWRNLKLKRAPEKELNTVKH